MTVLEQLTAFAQTGRTALVNREERVTYRELNAWSDAFAAWLLESLGEDRSPVVLCGDKETGFLPCLFGALKAGRAYVPIDSVVPEDRAAQIIGDVCPKVVVDFTGRMLDCDAVVLSPAAPGGAGENLCRAGGGSPRKLGGGGGPRLHPLYLR